MIAADGRLGQRPDHGQPSGRTCAIGVVMSALIEQVCRVTRSRAARRSGWLAVGQADAASAAAPAVLPASPARLGAGFGSKPPARATMATVSTSGAAYAARQPAEPPTPPAIPPASAAPSTKPA